jgi:pimeloyl-ACP methyl ester carboxylesterase
MTLQRLIKVSLLVLLPTLSINIAQSAQNIQWQPYQLKHKSGEQMQTAQGEVGYIQVPENRQSKNGKTLKLGFVRLPSTAANPGNPIVYLSGGPGGSATGTAQGPRFPLFVKMREVADVILFDQRGTGLSRNDLKNCQYQPKIKMQQHYTRQTLLADIDASARFCAKEWAQQGVDLNAYNTLESGADLEASREVLGVKK